MQKVPNKNLLIAFILFTGLVSLQFQCNKRIGCGSVFSFEMGIRTYPDKETIAIGDTIWLEVNEPTTLTDVQTVREINFSGAANLGSLLSFHELSSSNQFTEHAAAKFDYVLQKGKNSRSIDPSFERNYLFSEEGNRYLFKLGIVAKEKGTFRLFFSNAANVYRENDRCTKASFTLNFKNTNQHYPLSPTYQGGTLVGGDYYFKVQ